MSTYSPEVHVHKADTGRHLHDYYEGDVLQLYVDFPDEFREEYGDAVLDEELIQEILNHCRMKIGFGNENQFIPNLVGPYAEGNRLGDFKICWTWITEGARFGMYQMEVEFDDVELFAIVEQTATPAPKKAASQPQSPVKKKLASTVSAH